VSVRAGLANVQRGDVGVRRPQQPPQQAAGPDVERYNAFLQSPEFQSATPLEQLSTVASWDLPAETKAPVVAAIKANMQRQSQTAKYNQFLQSEQFKVMKPETQIAMVQSWNLTPEQKAQVIEAIRPGSGKLSKTFGPMPPEPIIGVREPAQAETPMSLFGPKRSYYNPSTGVLTEELPTRQGGKIYTQVKPATTAEIIAGKAVLSPQTSMALTGLNLVTVMAPAVAIPKVFGVGAAAGVGVGEAVKYGLTGKHLTVEESIGAAGVGEMVALSVVGVRSSLQSRAQARMDVAYQRAVENQELYKPGVTDKILMKATGVRPSPLAQGIIGAGETPPVSFKMLQQGRISSEAEDYFWNAPTPRAAQLYVRGYSSSKAWVETTLVKRMHLEGLFTLTVPTKLLMETTPKIEPKMPYIPSEPDIATSGKTILPKGAFSIAALSALGSLQRTALLQQQKQRIENIQITALRQEQSQIQESIQTQKQVQRENQAIIAFNRVRTPTNMLPSGFKFEGPSFDIAPLTRRQKTRGRKRTYPILTGEEVLKLSW
jgi:hypothetical protein